MNRTLFLTASLAAVSLFGQAKTDLSGTWKLNVDKSDFGPLPPTTSRTDVITQTDSQIKDVASQETADGHMDLTFAYNTDGSQSVNKFRGQDVKSTAKWDGAAFAIQSKLMYQEQEVTIDAKWTASADGKSLTEAIHYTSPMGEADQTLVFERAAAGAAGSAPAAAPAPPTPPAVPAAPVAPSASTATHPDFSGTWKMNIAKSDFGAIPPPESRVDKIDHKDPALKVSYNTKGGPQGDQTGELDFTTDGKPTTNSLAGNDFKGTAVWDGAQLVFDDTLTVQGSDIVIKSRWELSPDGKTLTQTAHISGPMGEMDAKYLFEKQAE